MLTDGLTSSIFTLLRQQPSEPFYIPLTTSYHRVNNYHNDNKEQKILIRNDSNRVIDIESFQFLIEPQCVNISWDISSVMVLVHSAPNNTLKRKAIRETWGSSIPVYFLLGEEESGQEIGQEEAVKYGDIIVGSFVDSYRNLTYKHVMGLLWSTARCPRAPYILKTDDDVYVNVNNLIAYLNNISPYGAHHLLACDVIRRSLVFRTYRSKWRVSYSEYSKRFYPVYCFGWVILYSSDVAHLFYQESQRTPYFWVDDVYVTGILAEKLNISHTSVRDYVVVDKKKINEITRGSYKKPFLFVLIPSSNTLDLFYDIHSSVR